MRVEAAAGQEGDYSQRHGGGGNGKANSPGHRVLDVDNHCDRQAAAPIDGKVEPVEETLLLQSILCPHCTSQLIAYQWQRLAVYHKDDARTVTLSTAGMK